MSVRPSRAVRRPTACSRARALCRGVPRASPLFGFEVDAASNTGKTEIGDPEMADVVDEQVRRFDVAVDHVIGVGIFEGLGRLSSERRGATSRKGASMGGRVSRSGDGGFPGRDTSVKLEMSRHRYG